MYSVVAYERMLLGEVSGAVGEARPGAQAVSRPPQLLEQLSRVEVLDVPDTSRSRCRGERCARLGIERFQSPCCSYISRAVGDAPRAASGFSPTRPAARRRTY